jgi:oxygen-independent coproporphyrinogen-3 oxidase
LAHVAHEGVFELAPELTSVYVGGGTPSLLGPDAMGGLAEILGQERLAGSDLEWTAEANPESFDARIAGQWQADGVNRVSLGVQTFDDPTLRWMGRMHGADGGERAVGVARAAGIHNISVDLMFGLPARLGRSWSGDLARVLDLGVPHVSLYGLTVEPGTALGRAVAESREPPVDEDRYAEEFLEAAETLTRSGYVHYEVSNFALPGYTSRHNAVYWRGDPYLGLGNGAHSYAPPLRRWNLRDWEAYRASLSSGAGAESDRERVDDEAAVLESVWLDLRTHGGVVEPDAGTRRALLADRWVSDGLAIREDGRIRLTPDGWLLLDRLAVEYAG